MERAGYCGGNASFCAVWAWHSFREYCVRCRCFVIGIYPRLIAIVCFACGASSIKCHYSLSGIFICSYWNGLLDFSAVDIYVFEIGTHRTLTWVVYCAHDSPLWQKYQFTRSSVFSTGQSQLQSTSTEVTESTGSLFKVSGNLANLVCDR